MHRMEATKVLNIQSHVVHGYVGNKATTFPLQMLNWDVDVLNTVNFSNHTGYGSWTGTCTTPEELDNIYKGLKKIGLEYDALLTGYVFGHEALRSVGEICIDIKKRSTKDVLWVLDPVMGDEGEMYVSEDVIPVYRNILESGLVDIVTPNQFELEILLDVKVNSIDDLKAALKEFHRKYKVKHVVLSSLDKKTVKEISGDDETILCCVSSDSEKLVYFKIQHVGGYFVGVGDLFSALLLDRYYHSKDITVATNEVLSVMKKVLKITASMSNFKGVIGDSNMKDCELRIIECKNVYHEHVQGYKEYLA